MKKLLLTIMFIGCTAVSGFAQDRERRVGLDDFGTSRGVNVALPKPVAKIALTPAATTKTDKKGDVKSVRKVVVGRPISYQSTVNSMELPTSSGTNYAAKSATKTSGVLGGFSTGDSTIDSYILGACNKHNVDPLLIYAQMHQESSFKLRATSYKGARGLMQLMPATAVRFGVTDIYDPQQNIYAGVKYMRWLLDTFDQDVNLALAGYNAGEGAVMKYGYTIPPYNETQEYVRRISNRYALLRDPNAVRSALPTVVAAPVQAKKTASKGKVSTVSTASLQKPSRPLNIYEKSVSVVRMSDGTMQLVSQ